MQKALNTKHPEDLGHNEKTKSKDKRYSWTVVTHTHAFNPSIWEAEAGRFLSLGPLVYRVSSRTARATQRNTVPNKTKQTNKQTKLSTYLNGIFKIENINI